MGSHRSTPHRVDDQVLWTLQRNQQRNWDTMNQIISLRCLPQHITQPQREGDHWSFEFDVENPAALSDHGDDLLYLRRDADGVPMITDLQESLALAPVIRVSGADTNTWFVVREHKYSDGGE
jgi:hypothetical protein